ncbi:MAG TPA: DUF4159 domain-containing protein [Thermodesulfobacteriota bacterium]|nr:DUF4159 domain-containing protein [Thermodesulfobacteriota bacterium]
MITRRDFLKFAIAGGIGITSLPFFGFGEASRFHFSQLIYRGEWDPRPRAYKRLMASLDLRTSVETAFYRTTLRAEDANLFYYPFLYMAGKGGFEPFTEEEHKRLRRFLKLGGTLLIDDVSGEENSPFDSQVREELTKILPESSLDRIPYEHAVFKSFYLLYSASGRRIVKPYLEGITFYDEDRTPVIYSRNDLGGAWSEDEFGKWEYECVPGGESQRELSFRLGVNLIMYALTGNYKKDQIHTPFIKRRQRTL